MAVSVYSVVTGLVWFTLAALIGSVTLRKTTKGGMFLVVLIFVLALFRIFVPLDFKNSIVIRSQHWYPLFQDWILSPLFGPYTAGECLLFIWFSGTAVRLLTLSRKLILLQRVHRKARQVHPSDHLALLAREVSEEVGYSGKIDLSVSACGSNAFQAGYIRPFIILPSNIDTFNDTEIRNMMRHELCHFLGKDLWLKAGMQVIACALWWNPVMRLLNNSIEQMLELRCDQRVCRDLSSEAQLSYLQTLLRLVEINSKEPSPLSLGYIGGSDNEYIVQRFNFIIKYNKKTPPTIKVVCGAILCIVLFVASYCFILQPWYAPPPEVQNYTDASLSVGYYIIHTPDGEYKLYYNSKFMFNLYNDQLANEPFSSYTIYEGGYFSD